MLKRFSALAAIAFASALLIGTERAEAGDRLVVLELFTSQGCDRCPPVDAMVHELAKEDDILPLALHVNYWDYMGWADSFALDINVHRQMAYAPRTDRRRLFTPLMMIGGIDPVAGYTPMQVINLIQKHRALDTNVSLETRLQGNEVQLLGMSEYTFGRPAEVVLVSFRPQATVEITRGQNAGRTVTYTNVVTGWQKVGTWDGSSPIAVSVPRPAEAGAILVQSAEYGMILAAVRLPQ